MNFLEFVTHYNYGHIPSALSQIYYLNYIFNNKLVEPYKHNIVIGKPFGGCAYYYIWERLGYIESKKYHVGVKDTEIDFVDFSDETIGNSLGVSSGIELGNGKMTYVNMSDSQLQMGSVIEAIQFIGRTQQNIKLTIDYNRSQLTSELLTSTLSDYSIFTSNGWSIFNIEDDYDNIDDGFKLDGPVVFFMKTNKGDGIVEMQDNPLYWHYREVEDEMLTMTDKLINL